MRIAVLGSGPIGTTLARKFVSAGHEVRLANSRHPNTITEVAARMGASAMTATEAVRDGDVVITAIPLWRAPELKSVLAGAPDRAIVIDTSNYFPGRDHVIPALESGQVESRWVSEQFGRPLVKAWNNILAGSLAKRNLPPGHGDCTALPVAADDTAEKLLAMYLVELTGFDAVDGGAISDSWRQQPGSPAYTTELMKDELLAALARANRASLHGQRDRMLAEVRKLGGRATNDEILRISRTIFLCKIARVM